jgi:PAS domain S-box-containing protein
MLILVGVTWFALYKFSALESRFALSNSGFHRLTQVLNRLRETELDGRASIQNLFREDANSEALKSRRSIFTKLASDVAEGRHVIERVRVYAQSEDDKIALEQIHVRYAGLETSLATYLQNFEMLETLIQAKRRDETLFFQRALEQARLEFVADLSRLSKEIDRRIKLVSIISERDGRHASVTLLTTIIITCGIAIIIFISIQRSLGKLTTLTTAAQKLQQGNFSPKDRIPVGISRAKDEIHVLAQQFNSMAASILQRDMKLAERRRELLQAFTTLSTLNKQFQALGIHYRNIIDSVSSAVFVVDPDGTILTMNRASQTLWKVAEKDFTGTHYSNLECVKTAPGLSDAIHTALHGSTSVHLDTLNYKRDGKTMILDMVCLPFVNDSGQPNGVIVTADDITEKTRAKNQMIQNERLATVGRMSAQIAHEIRNPLNSITLNTELLGQMVSSLTTEDTEIRTIVSDITGEIDRLSNVIEEYLKFARPPRPTKKRQDVNQLIDRVLGFLQPKNATRKIEIINSFDPELPPVLIDDGQIRQALLNIFKNSFEAMPNQGKMSVATRHMNDRVEINIQDSGTGLTKSEASEIFSPFYSTKDNGTGLGLAITQQIIHDHGGTVVCEPTDDSPGTVFRISLPV